MPEQQPRNNDQIEGVSKPTPIHSEEDSQQKCKGCFGHFSSG